MAEYIEREAVLEKLCSDCVDGCTRHCAEYTMLKYFPAADVRPVRRGKWTSVFDIETVCNQCGYDIEEHGYDVRTDGEPNFCPNCGAKMEEGEK